MSPFHPESAAEGAVVRIRFAPGARRGTGAELGRPGAWRAPVLNMPDQAALGAEVRRAASPGAPGRRGPVADRPGRG